MGKIMEHILKVDLAGVLARLFAVLPSLPCKMGGRELRTVITLNVSQ
jgi:hypothetical protein